MATPDIDRTGGIDIHRPNYRLLSRSFQREDRHADHKDNEKREKLPYIVLKDVTGRRLDTFTHLQEAIYRARQNIRQTREALTADEWRLPHAPLPARPDYSRAAPPMAKLREKFRGEFNQLSRSTKTTSTRIVEVDVDDVAFVAQSINHLPSMPSLSFLRQEILAEPKNYFQIVQTMLLHKRLMKQTDKREAVHNFPGFCTGCRRAGLCYGCEQSLIPHYHTDRLMKTGGGFTYYKKYRPEHEIAGRHPLNWKVQFPDQALKSVMKGHDSGEMSLLRDSVEHDENCLLKELIDNQTSFPEINRDGQLTTDNLISRENEEKNEDEGIVADRKSLEDKMSKRDQISARMSGTSGQGSDHSGQTGEGYQDEFGNFQNGTSGPFLHRRIVDLRQEEQDEDEQSYDENFIKESMDKASIGTRESGDRYGEEDAEGVDRHDEEMSTDDENEKGLHKSRSRSRSRSTKQSLEQPLSTSSKYRNRDGSYTTKSSSPYSRKYDRLYQGKAYSPETSGSPGSRRRLYKGGGDQDELYTTPPAFKLRKTDRKKIQASNPFSNDRNYDLNLGKKFELKKSDKKLTEFKEFQNQRGDWKAPDKFELKRNERDEIKFWKPTHKNKENKKKGRSRKTQHPVSPDSGLDSEKMAEMKRQGSGMTYISLPSQSSSYGSRSRNTRPQTKDSGHGQRKSLISGVPQLPPIQQESSSSCESDLDQTINPLTDKDTANTDLDKTDVKSENYISLPKIETTCSYSDTTKDMNEQNTFKVLKQKGKNVFNDLDNVEMNVKSPCSPRNDKISDNSVSKKYQFQVEQESLRKIETEKNKKKKLKRQRKRYNLFEEDTPKLKENTKPNQLHNIIPEEGSVYSKKNSDLSEELRNLTDSRMTLTPRIHQELRYLTDSRMTSTPRMNPTPYISVDDINLDFDSEMDHSVDDSYLENGKIISNDELEISESDMEIALGDGKERKKHVQFQSPVDNVEYLGVEEVCETDQSKVTKRKQKKTGKRKLKTHKNMKLEFDTCDNDASNSMETSGELGKKNDLKDSGFMEEKERNSPTPRERKGQKKIKKNIELDSRTGRREQNEREIMSEIDDSDEIDASDSDIESDENSQVDMKFIRSDGNEYESGSDRNLVVNSNIEMNTTDTRSTSSVNDQNLLSDLEIKMVAKENKITDTGFPDVKLKIDVKVKDLDLHNQVQDSVLLQVKQEGPKTDTFDLQDNENVQSLKKQKMRMHKNHQSSKHKVISPSKIGRRKVISLNVEQKTDLDKTDVKSDNYISLPKLETTCSSSDTTTDMNGQNTFKVLKHKENNVLKDLDNVEMNVKSPCSPRNDKISDNSVSKKYQFQVEQESPRKIETEKKKKKKLKRQQKRYNLFEEDTPKLKENTKPNQLRNIIPEEGSVYSENFSDLSEELRNLTDSRMTLTPRIHQELRYLTDSRMTSTPRMNPTPYISVDDRNLVVNSNIEMNTTDTRSTSSVNDQNLLSDLEIKMVAKENKITDTGFPDVKLKIDVKVKDLDLHNQVQDSVLLQVKQEGPKTDTFDLQDNENVQSLKKQKMRTHKNHQSSKHKVISPSKIGRRKVISLNVEQKTDLDKTDVKSDNYISLPKLETTCSSSDTTTDMNGQNTFKVLKHKENNVLKDLDNVEMNVKSPCSPRNDKISDNSVSKKYQFQVEQESPRKIETEKKKKKKLKRQQKRYNLFEEDTPKLKENTKPNQLRNIIPEEGSVYSENFSDLSEELRNLTDSRMTLTPRIHQELRYLTDSRMTSTPRMNPTPYISVDDFNLDFDSEMDYSVDNSYLENGKIISNDELEISESDMKIALGDGKERKKHVQFQSPVDNVEYLGVEEVCESDQSKNTMRKQKKTGKRKLRTHKTKKLEFDTCDNDASNSMETSGELGKKNDLKDSGFMEEKERNSPTLRERKGQKKIKKNIELDSRTGRREQNEREIMSEIDDSDEIDASDSDIESDENSQVDLKFIRSDGNEYESGSDRNLILNSDSEMDTTDKGSTCSVNDQNSPSDLEIEMVAKENKITDTGFPNEKLKIDVKVEDLDLHNQVQESILVQVKQEGPKNDIFDREDNENVQSLKKQRKRMHKNHQSSKHKVILPSKIGRRKVICPIDEQDIVAISSDEHDKNVDKTQREVVLSPDSNVKQIKKVGNEQSCSQQHYSDYSTESENIENEEKSQLPKKYSSESENKETEEKAQLLNKYRRRKRKHRRSSKHKNISPSNISRRKVFSIRDKQDQVITSPYEQDESQRESTFYHHGNDKEQIVEKAVDDLSCSKPQYSDYSSVSEEERICRQAESNDEFEGKAMKNAEIDEFKHISEYESSDGSETDLVTMISDDNESGNVNIIWDNQNEDIFIKYVVQEENKDDNLHTSSEKGSEVNSGDKSESSLFPQIKTSADGGDEKTDFKSSDSMPGHDNVKRVSFDTSQLPKIQEKRNSFQRQPLKKAIHVSGMSEYAKRKQVSMENSNQTLLFNLPDIKIIDAGHFEEQGDLQQNTFQEKDQLNDLDMKKKAGQNLKKGDNSNYYGNRRDGRNRPFRQKGLESRPMTRERTLMFQRKLVIPENSIPAQESQPQVLESKSRAASPISYETSSPTNKWISQVREANNPSTNQNERMTNPLTNQNERTTADDSIDLIPQVLSLHGRKQPHSEMAEPRQQRLDDCEAENDEDASLNDENDATRRSHDLHENQSHVVQPQSGAISPIVYETTGCPWINSGDSENDSENDGKDHHGYQPLKSITVQLPYISLNQSSDGTISDDDISNDEYFDMPPNVLSKNYILSSEESDLELENTSDITKQPENAEENRHSYRHIIHKRKEERNRENESLDENMLVSSDTKSKVNNRRKEHLDDIFVKEQGRKKNQELANDSSGKRTRKAERRRKDFVDNIDETGNKITEDSSDTKKERKKHRRKRTDGDEKSGMKNENIDDSPDKNVRRRHRRKKDVEADETRDVDDSSQRQRKERGRRTVEVNETRDVDDMSHRLKEREHRRRYLEEDENLDESSERRLKKEHRRRKDEEEDNLSKREVRGNLRRRKDATLNEGNNENADDVEERKERRRRRRKEQEINVADVENEKQDDEVQDFEMRKENRRRRKKLTNNDVNDISDKNDDEHRRKHRRERRRREKQGINIEKDGENQVKKTGNTVLNENYDISNCESEPESLNTALKNYLCSDTVNEDNEYGFDGNESDEMEKNGTNGEIDISKELLNEISWERNDNSAADETGAVTTNTFKRSFKNNEIEAENKHTYDFDEKVTDDKVYSSEIEVENKHNVDLDEQLADNILYSSESDDDRNFEHIDESFEQKGKNEGEKGLKDQENRRGRKHRRKHRRHVRNSSNDRDIGESIEKTGSGWNDMKSDKSTKDNIPLDDVSEETDSDISENENSKSEISENENSKSEISENENLKSEISDRKEETGKKHIEKQDSRNQNLNDGQKNVSKTSQVMSKDKKKKRILKKKRPTKNIKKDIDDNDEVNLNDLPSIHDTLAKLLPKDKLHLLEKVKAISNLDDLLREESEKSDDDQNMDDKTGITNVEKFLSADTEASIRPRSASGEGLLVPSFPRHLRRTSSLPNIANFDQQKVDLPLMPEVVPCQSCGEKKPEPNHVCLPKFKNRFKPKKTRDPNKKVRHGGIGVRRPKDNHTDEWDIKSEITHTTDQTQSQDTTDRTSSQSMSVSKTTDGTQSQDAGDGLSSQNLQKEPVQVPEMEERVLTPASQRISTPTDSPLPLAMSPRLPTPNFTVGKHSLEPIRTPSPVVEKPKRVIQKKQFKKDIERKPPTPVARSCTPQTPIPQEKEPETAIVTPEIEEEEDTTPIKLPELIRLETPPLPEITEKKKEPVVKDDRRTAILPVPKLKEAPKSPTPKKKKVNMPKMKRRSRQAAEAPVTKEEVQKMQDPLDFLAKYCIVSKDRLPFYERIYHNIVEGQPERYERQPLLSPRTGMPIDKDDSASHNIGWEEHQLNMFHDLVTISRGRDIAKPGVNVSEQYLEKISYTLEILDKKQKQITEDLHVLQGKKLSQIAEKAKEMIPEIARVDYHPKAGKKSKKKKKKKDKNLDQFDEEPPSIPLKAADITNEVIAMRLDESTYKKICKKGDIPQIDLEMQRCAEKLAGIDDRLMELEGERNLLTLYCMEVFFNEQNDNHRPVEFRRQQSALYKHLHPDPDVEMNMEELEGALQVVNHNLISESEFEYLYQILNLPGRRKINFQLFTIIAALSEKISQMDPVIKKLLIKDNPEETKKKRRSYEALDLKMETSKELFGLLADGDYETNNNGNAKASSLAVELAAGGLDPEHVGYVLSKFNRFGTGYIDFMDFVTYVPLFIEIHQKIVDDPFNVSLDV